ncbi:putative membrane protein At1g16860 [Bidens hawaiensis]|uniref:putative membrane protein At1g16860 n=1 Tax=Bidens hawaiensis TaxID=980011 RepID=UPI00404B90B3
MSSRITSHQLNNGLYVSGRPEPPKEKAPTMFSTAVPYTGRDIKKSGELGKMFDGPRKSGQLTSGPLRTGSMSGSNTGHSGQISSHSMTRMSSLSGSVTGSGSMKKTSSGPLNKHGEPIRKSYGSQGQSLTSGPRHNSGPQPPVLPATGLITSGPILSGPLNSSGGPRKSSGPLDSSLSIKSRTSSMVKNQAVTHLSQEGSYSFFRSFPKLVLWSIVMLFVMGFISAVFILAAVGNPVLLIVVGVLFAIVSLPFVWNVCRGRKAVIKFISEYPDAELRTAKDGQFVKVLGVVTCGNVPLESSFQRVPRCVYTSTSLYEYRGWDSKAANPTHQRFTWGLRSMERHVVDFYISDFQSGLRALVKTGYGARVTPYVEESAVIDINQSNKDASPQFIRWLAERNLSSDDRLMRLKEGYIKEGSSVSVMGVVQRNDNVLMIVPPPEPVPTGCQWATCMLPASLDGIVLRCYDSSNPDVIPV